MLNQKPTFQVNNKGKLKYHQGLFIPKHPEKVIKLNNQGGLYFRSSWEKKILIYLDSNPAIERYSCEQITIQYQLPEMKDGILEYSNHRYYPDFYYELRKSNGELSKVVAEVKPYNETQKPILAEKYSHKQLKNWEYAIQQYTRNCSKWNAAIEFCRKAGMEFVIVTEVFLNKISK